MIMTLIRCRQVGATPYARASLIAVLVAGSPAIAGACSLAPYPSFWRPNLFVFVGTAGADTVRAGPGAVRYTLGEGHFGRGVPREIYGQVVTVDRVGDRTRALLQRLGAAHRREVVLVPWDYSPSCEPVPWSRSARWMTPGTRGLFWVMPRDTAHWVAGVPTFDVYGPQFAPYPSAPGFQSPRWRARAAAAGQDSILTPEELLALYDVLPEYPRRGDSAYAAARVVQRWAQEHPSMARRPPAADLIRTVLFSAESERVRGMRSPLAGTYRFALTLPSSDSLVLFARTEEHATSPLWSVAWRPPSRADTGVRRPVGHHLLAVGASNLESLPATRRSSGLPVREGYLVMADVPVTAGPDSTAWQGSVDLVRVAAAVTSDDRIRMELRAAELAMSDLRRAGHLSYVPGRFVQYRDGRMRFEADIRRSDGTPILAIRGERLSNDLLAEPPPAPSSGLTSRP